MEELYGEPCGVCGLIVVLQTPGPPGLMMLEGGLGAQG